MTEWGRGKFGQSGGRLIARQFDLMTAEGLIRSPVESARGFEARLRYLLNHQGGGEALYQAGPRPDVARVVGWLTGDIQPRAQTRAQVEAAYITLRKRNQSNALKGRLGHGGRGTRITVEPLAPSALPPDQQRRQAQFDTRELNVRPSTWNRFVDLWAEGDYEGMEDEWMDLADQLGSPPEAYYEVAHVGFAA